MSSGCAVAAHTFGAIVNTESLVELLWAYTSECFPTGMGYWGLSELYLVSASINAVFICAVIINVHNGTVKSDNT